MKFEMKYGKSVKSFDINSMNWAGTLVPSELKMDQSAQEILSEAMANPIGTPQLKELVKAGEKVAIVTSDITRPMPSHEVLPHVISELKSGGISEEDITIVLALGSHRPHTEAEKERLVGAAVYSEIRVIDSDMRDCVRLGTCRNMTPADVFKPVAEADRVICLGNIEYHYFAGYSGGAKAIMPGVSSHEAIQANHKNMIHKDARAANLDTNPVRQDIDEIADFLKIDFIVNVVLSAKKDIVGAFAGHWKQAHRKGCEFLDEMYALKIKSQADIVIVSPGGYPKDLNLYQAQKGLDNAKHAVKPGGAIILCASAAEGFGEKTFESWMMNMTPAQRVEEISKNFRLGGHKAAAIGQIQQRATVYMVTDLAEDIVSSIGFIHCADLQSAVDSAVNEQGSEAQVLVMPAAGSTLPVLEPVDKTARKK